MFKGKYLLKENKPMIDVRVKYYSKEYLDEKSWRRKAIDKEKVIQEKIGESRDHILGYYGHEEEEGAHYFIYEFCFYGTLELYSKMGIGKRLTLV